MLRNLVPLILTLERDPRRVCSFTARLRVTNLDELLSYLDCLVAIGRAVEAVTPFTDLPFHLASPEEQGARLRLRNPFAEVSR
jgi:hypothetical protein